MIRVHEEFLTEGKARQFKDDYERNYHPAGYGTRLTVLPPNGHRSDWTVTGHRFASCD